MGGEAGGCASDCNVMVVGMGFEADIAAPFVRTFVSSRDRLIARVNCED